MKNKTRTAVLITAYNEADNIFAVVRNIADKYDVYVVDDGSTDDTARVARGAGAKTLILPINLGQGAASIVGYKLINRLNYDYLVKMDGDGQHRPEDIEKLLEEIKKPDIDLVIGSRVLGSNYEGAPATRSFFLKPLTEVLNYITGYEVTDSMSGFKAYKVEFLPTFVKLLDDTLEPQYMATELWLRLAWLNINVSEVPIDLEERTGGASHKGHALLKYGFGILKTLIRTKLDTMREDDLREY